MENEDESKRKPNLHHSLHPVYHTRQLNIILQVSLIRKLKFNLLLFCNVDLEVELIHKKEVEEHQLIVPE